MKTKLTAIVILICIIFSALYGCGNDKSSNDKTTNGTAQAVTTGEIGVIEDEEYGGIFIDITIEKFNTLGFNFGDSVNISFDNGTKLDDIPYYNGYYVSVNELLLCGYPGSPYVKIARNYGDSAWEEFHMTKDSKVTVTMNEKAKYLSTQEANELVYSDKREDFDSDDVFANFREVRGGALRKKSFYRSASPCDNCHNRAPYANALAEEYGIKFVINLSDNKPEYISLAEEDDYESEYYDNLYKDGDVMLLGLDLNYRSDEFEKSVSEAFLNMTDHDAPCLIHCVEGKDRTGFMCALLLALADASSEQIVDDYMETYKNYYSITKESQSDKYEAVVVNINDFLCYMCDAEKGTTIDTLDLKKGAENYLRKGGLSENQITKIEAYIK
ncbi:MAG: tyrosine-protein phosphatase [Ruminococcus sp.]|nr:tyrosine-protein phosphatase [Ruminococcus sp.]